MYTLFPIWCAELDRLGSLGENAADGLGLELLSLQAGGKRGSGLAQEAGLSEGWWASHRVPIHCDLGKLPHPVMPDACSSCAGCPVDLDPICEAESRAPGSWNLCLLCSGSGKRFAGIKHGWCAFLAAPHHSPRVIGAVCRSLRGSNETPEQQSVLAGHFQPQTP